MKKSYRPLVQAFIVTMIIVAAPLFQEAHAVSPNTPWSKMTQSKLTAVWWQWLYSIPTTQSPVYDPPLPVSDPPPVGGGNAYNGQPYSDLLFLAGTFIVNELTNGDVLGQVTRAIEVKQGTALFFPLINSEWDNVCAKPRLGGNCYSAEKFPNVKGVPALRDLAASIEDAFDLYAILTPTDGDFPLPPCPYLPSCSNVYYARLQSPPFSYALPAADNLYQYQGLDVSGRVGPAVGDGYYVFIPPGTLTAGYYLLQFGGSVPFTDAQGEPHKFTEEITYQITVIE